jgi:hypothetical protein
MYFNGSLNLEGVGTDVLFISPQGDHLKYVLQIHYKVSNNGAEYEALIHGLRITVYLRIKRLIAYDDFKKETMNAYCAEVLKLKDHFEGLEFHHVSRDNNVAVDALSKLGSKRVLVPTSVFIQDLRKPSIKLLNDLETSPNDVSGSSDVLKAEAEDNWLLDFIAYIVEKCVPDKVERDKIVRRATNYIVIGTELYQRSASNGVLMKYILRYEGLELLQEIHGGECGNHAPSVNLVGKAYRSGFYWPTALADAQDLV